MRTTRKKIIIGAVTGLTAVIAGATVIHQARKAPSSAEFFARNPHLTAPVVTATPENELARSSDQFQPGDFQLLEGRSYPIRVSQGIKLTGNEKELLDLGFAGTVELHSLGIQNRLLNVIVEFRYELARGTEPLSAESRALLGMAAARSGVKGRTRKSSRTGLHSASQATPPVSTQLLVRLEPSGKIREVLSPHAKQDPASIELKVTALNLLFRRLPALQKGTLVRSEADHAGRTFPVSYTISESGSDALRVVGRTTMDQTVGGSPSKAAAAGLPDLALISLATTREQTLDWIWDRKISLPRTQKTSSRSDVRNGGTVLSSYSGEAMTAWGVSGMGLFSRADAARFTHSVDFVSVLSRNGARLRSIASRSRGPTSRSWDEIRDQMSSLRSMNESDREKLFLDLARSVKEDPSQIASLQRAAMDAAPGSREVSMILGALGFEGSPAAQAAMIQIFQRPGTTGEEKQKVMTEFVLGTQALTASTKIFLRENYSAADPTASDVAGGAGLALGASIARDGDPSTVEFLRSEWSSHSGGFFSSGSDPSRQAYILTAMGNSKSDAFLSEVKSAIDSEEEQIRAAAVNAVRFAQDEKSREILFTSLQGDSSTEVKSVAAQSLLYQPFDERTRNALQSCSGQSSQTAVKIECYRVLGSRIEQAGVREYLQSRNGSEPDPQVAAVIAGALSIQADSNSSSE